MRVAHRPFHSKILTPALKRQTVAKGRDEKGEGGVAEGEGGDDDMERLLGGAKEDGKDVVWEWGKSGVHIDTQRDEVAGLFFKLEGKAFDSVVET